MKKFCLRDKDRTECSFLAAHALLTGVAMGIVLMQIHQRARDKNSCKERLLKIIGQ